MIDQVSFEFFHSLGDYAFKHETCIGMEANPTIYNTNFVNTTSEALALIKSIDSKGFKLNLDLGTMVYNQEEVSVLENNVNLINHVHISEPKLVAIQPRQLHQDLLYLLKRENYQGYISIEMGNQNSIKDLENAMFYVKNLFEIGVDCLQ